MFSPCAIRALSQRAARRSAPNQFPSISTFFNDPRNEKALKIMPSDLFSRLQSNPSPEADFESYQEALEATSRWLNEFVASQMKTATSEAAYTTELLDIYDAMVWRYNSPFLWRIQQEQVQEMYNACLATSQAHCEIAVGTGLFLSHLQEEPTTTLSKNHRPLTHLTLMDLQPTALEACQKRLLESESYKNIPIKLQLANILEEPPPHLRQSFDSVAANFLVHCLPPEYPGNDNVIHTTFRHCASLLRPTASTINKDEGAEFFGSTILGQELLDDQENAGPAAIATLLDYNRDGVFGNEQHSFEDVRDALHSVFHHGALATAPRGKPHHPESNSS